MFLFLRTILHDFLTSALFSAATRQCLYVTGFTALLILVYGTTVTAQTCRDASVELRADVQADPPVITLNWPPHDDANNFVIYRKLKSENNWGSVMSILDPDATQYVDTTVSMNVSYEYRVLKTSDVATGHGYINSGIEVQATEFRGIMILVIEETIKDSLALEIATLVDDLEGDGWQVRSKYVSRDADVTSVKETIVNTYNEDKTNTKAVYLLGRIPVPYSGDIFPDGHPDHEGAWPADVYYGEMNGNWTDNVINVVVANQERHRNTPGDGKFDQSVIPGDTELQVGRVDFANMPAFTATEIQLLRNYLNKSHAYKHKMFAPVHRAVVDDNFGYFSGEAFAASSWKNFGPLCGPENVEAGDYFTTMADSSYLWSYGCGGGSYTSAGGIGNTNNFAASNLQSVFTMLFGSYFGDWDATNNFLRAPLAQGTTLTNAWSGRPHWMFHHMGLGENIGYSARLTQNNNGFYHASYGARFIHIALMGDPSLRNDVVAPAKNVVATRLGDGAEISWEASDDNVMGYHVYVKSDQTPEYIRLNDEPVLSGTYTHPCLPDTGLHTFMVRGLALQTSPSGTYYNLSQGLTDTAMITGVKEVEAYAEYEVAEFLVFFSNFSVNANAYEWHFGDGEISTEENPVHTYMLGAYSGYLVAWNNCSTDTFFFDIDITTGMGVLLDNPNIHITPSPSDGLIQVRWDDTDATALAMRIFSTDGHQVFVNKYVTNGATLDLTSLPPGIYVIHITRGEEESMKRIVLE